jgi:MFS transporter, YNFM family, putative membrane transport protein
MGRCSRLQRWVVPDLANALAAWKLSRSVAGMVRLRPAWPFRAAAPPSRESTTAWAGHARGSFEYRRLNAALCLAGVATFMMLYSAQALLPSLTAEYGASPATASLVLSATTGALALCLIPATVVGDRWGRVRVMTVSLTVATALGLLVPLAPSFAVLLVIRLLQGVAMAGLPALAMAHLVDEVHSRAVGRAMGLYIAGNTVGGLSGRLLASAVADVAGWRWGMAAVALLAVVCTVAFRLLLPASRAVQPRPASARVLAQRLGQHLRDPGIRSLCLISFLLMSAFVTVYNYLGYRLLAPPFALSQTVVGLVFLAYLAGTSSSPIAGALGDRFGRKVVLWASVLFGIGAAVLTLPDSLPLVLTGLVGLTVAFFAAHSVASAWISRRALRGRAQAAALYLLAYYAGSSAGGSLGGVAFGLGEWPAVVVYVALLFLAALALAMRLRRLAPTRSA